MPHVHRSVLLLIAAAVCTPVVAQAPEAEGPPPAAVSVATAIHADFAPLRWTPGSVTSREDARVAGEIGGRVTEVLEVGTRVRRGDALAKLDTTALVLREREALAAMRKVEAQLEYSRKQEQRYETLLRRSGISGAQRDEVRSARAMQEQELASARVALEQARYQLRHATVRAPFDGVVADRLVQRGEYLAVGAPVARLVNTGALEVRARAPVELAARLRAGMPLSLRIDDTLVEQPLIALVPVGDEASRQLELRVAFEDDDLPIGTAVQVGLPSAAPRRAIAVPRDALVLRKDGSYVMRVNAGDTAERVTVETGAAHNGLIEVRGALKPGDRVVVRGGERLQPGQKVLLPAAEVAAKAVAGVSE